MASRTWETAEIALLRRHVRDGLNAEQISRALTRDGLPRTHQAVRRKVQSLRKKDPHGWHALVRHADTPRHTRQIQLQADRVLLLFDIHAPFHDATWINRCIDEALDAGCTAVGVGGDLIDFASFSVYGREPRIEAIDEIDSAEQVVTTLARTFDRVVYAGGNHESRLPRKTDNLLGLAQAMELFVRAPNVEITDYHWFEVVSGGQRYYVEHPRNYSMHATIVPKALCSKYLCHVVAGHGHGWGITRDVSGRYWAIDAGMCADPLRLGYVVKQHSRAPAMQQGAVLLVDGVPRLLSPHIT